MYVKERKIKFYVKNIGEKCTILKGKNVVYARKLKNKIEKELKKS